VYVLTAMPIGIGGFLYMTNPEYLEPLWTTDIGRTMLWSALFAQVAGYIWMHRLTSIDF
jgi:tight adherence protein B